MKMRCYFLFLTGEVVTIPISRTITSIWSFPFGLLMEQAVETNSPVHVPFLSSSPLVGIRDIARARRETGHSPQSSASFLSTFDHVFKGDTSSISTHLILKDPLESPQVSYNSHPFLLGTISILLVVSSLLCWYFLISILFLLFFSFFLIIQFFLRRLGPFKNSFC